MSLSRFFTQNYWLVLRLALLPGLFVFGCAEPLDWSEIEGKKDQGSQCNETDKSGCPKEIIIVSESPSSIQVVKGNPFQINVVAQGHQLTYQWFKNFEEVSGSTEPTFAINASVDGDAGSYQVRITDGYGTNKLTNAFNVTVVPKTNFFAPIITQQPADIDIDVGRSGSIAVTATGDPAPTYQWYFNNSEIPGATGTRLNIQMEFATAGKYKVAVNNSVGGVWSREATVAVPACRPEGRVVVNPSIVASQSMVGAPKRLLADGIYETFYSSIAGDQNNTTGIAAELGWSTGRPLRTVKIYGRHLNNKFWGFPKRYEVLAAIDSQRINWRTLGIYTYQPPDLDTPVTLRYTGETNHYGLRIKPLELGQDDGKTYTLQLAEIEALLDDPNCQ
ncbi:MAG: hypothetical protein H6624_08670 [Bdellovibrionaceae bacterium]|nr:hypothetical protein [Pseudobdellovibrionaceae bacterium]